MCRTLKVFCISDRRNSGTQYMVWGDIGGRARAREG